MGGDDVDRIGQPSGTGVPAGQRPTAGSTTCTPRRSVAMLSTTAGCSHISVCIAGHTSTGARVASSVLRSRSVASPDVYVLASFWEFNRLYVSRIEHVFGAICR